MATKIAVRDCMDDYKKYLAGNAIVSKLSEQPNGLSKIAKYNETVQAINKQAERKEQRALDLKALIIMLLIVLLLGAGMVGLPFAEENSLNFLIPINVIITCGSLIAIIVVLKKFNPKEVRTSYINKEFANLTKELDVLRDEFIAGFSNSKEYVYVDVAMFYNDSTILNSKYCRVYIDDTYVHFVADIKVIKEVDDNKVYKFEDCIGVSILKNKYSYYQESGSVETSFYTSHYTDYETSYSKGSAVIDGETYTVNVEHKMPVEKKKVDTVTRDHRKLEMFFDNGIRVVFNKKNVEIGKQLIKKIGY